MPEDVQIARRNLREAGAGALYFGHLSERGHSMASMQRLFPVSLAPLALL